jgi:hypothetical protein
MNANSSQAAAVEMPGESVFHFAPAIQSQSVAGAEPQGEPAAVVASCGPAPLDRSPTMHTE